MEIRDVLYGSCVIEAHERGVLDSRYFQRLRAIKQLGFAEFSYPSATHNRYVHSLGAMHVATRAFENIFGSRRSESPGESRLGRDTYLRFRAVTRFAAMLHDIGHGPLSHTTEFAMPRAKALKVPRPGVKETDPNRQANHEDYTLKIILDSGLEPILARAGQGFGFKPLHVAALVDPSLKVDDGFFVETIDGAKIDFRPILQQLISSELDADRMDYLQRDSLHAGVSYGQFDFDWLVSNLTSRVEKGKCYLGLQHRALYAFEDFLISRFHMFLMVYFHYKSIVYDEMLQLYFQSAPGDYQLPSDIEAYVESNDAQLYAHLARSKNDWAKRITDKKPYRMLIEFHSGIPANKGAREQQERLLQKLKGDLRTKKTHFIEAKATGELSKYFRKPGDSIYVRYDNYFSEPSYIPLEKCTDLFERYSEKRSIHRLYVSPESYAEIRTLGRKDPIGVDEDVHQLELIP